MNDEIKKKRDIQSKFVNGKREKDYFGTAKLYSLNDHIKILNILLEYDKDSIKENK